MYVKVLITTFSTKVRENMFSDSVVVIGAQRETQRIMGHSCGTFPTKAPETDQSCCILSDSYEMRTNSHYLMIIHYFYFTNND